MDDKYVWVLYEKYNDGMTEIINAYRDVKVGIQGAENFIYKMADVDTINELDEIDSNFKNILQHGMLKSIKNVLDNRKTTPSKISWQIMDNERVISKVLLIRMDGSV